MLVGEDFPTLQCLPQIAGEELGEVMGGVVFVVVGEHLRKDKDEGRREEDDFSLWPFWRLL